MIEGFIGFIHTPHRLINTYSLFDNSSQFPLELPEDTNVKSIFSILLVHFLINTNKKGNELTPLKNCIFYIIVLIGVHCINVKRLQIIFSDRSYSAKRKGMTISTKQQCLYRQKVSMNYMKSCMCNYFIILFLALNKHRIFLLDV